MFIQYYPPRNPIERYQAEKRRDARMRQPDLDRLLEKEKLEWDAFERAGAGIYPHDLLLMGRGNDLPSWTPTRDWFWEPFWYAIHAYHDVLTKGGTAAWVPNIVPELDLLLPATSIHDAFSFTAIYFRFDRLRFHRIKELGFWDHYIVRLLDEKSTKALGEALDKQAYYIEDRKKNNGKPGFSFDFT